MRKDTIEDIRAILIDLQSTMSYIVSYPNLSGKSKEDENVSLQIHEVCYTLGFNIGVVVLRISKFLRRSGFAYVGMPFVGTAF